MPVIWSLKVDSGLGMIDKDSEQEIVQRADEIGIALREEQ